MKTVTLAATIIGTCLIVTATSAHADNICSSGYATGGGWLIEATDPVSPVRHGQIAANGKTTTPIATGQQTQTSSAGADRHVAVDDLPPLPGLLMIAPAKPRAAAASPPVSRSSGQAGG